MFLRILKHTKAKKFLRKYFAQQKKIEIDDIAKISAVACIVNIDEFKNIPALTAIAGDLNIEPAKFTIITYTKTPEKHKDMEYPLFSFKDFNWRLRVKESDTKTFLDNKYDVLINYFTKEKLPLLFLSILTRAGIRVGFKQLDYNYNDIIFKVNTGNPALFRKELLKYLKILNKI